MKKNVGSTDKVIRVLLGVVAILLGIMFHSWWGLIGVILLLTALVGVCPIWLVLRISTVKKTETQKT